MIIIADQFIPIDQIRLHVAAHVELHGKLKERIDLLALHGHHVERVSHGVQAEDLRQLAKAHSLLCAHLLRALRARVHVVSFQRVLDGQFCQRFVHVLHVGHLTTNGVEVLEFPRYVRTVEREHDVRQTATEQVAHELLELVGHLLQFADQIGEELGHVLLIAGIQRLQPVHGVHLAEALRIVRSTFALEQVGEHALQFVENQIVLARLVRIENGRA